MGVSSSHFLGFCEAPVVPATNETTPTVGVSGESTATVSGTTSSPGVGIAVVAAATVAGIGALLAQMYLIGGGEDS